MTHYAYFGTPGDTSDWQLLSEHLAQVGELASDRASPFGLATCAEVLGRFHDLGKYGPAFVRRLRNENVRVDH